MDELRQYIMNIVLWVIVLIISNILSYHLGNEAGYWEHEAEENIYTCEVLSA